MDMPTSDEVRFAVQKVGKSTVSGRTLAPTAAPGPLRRRAAVLRTEKVSRESDASARSLLLEAAIRLFCRFGIGATGIDAILAEAGVARMTIYNQFGSKEGLIVAALEHEGAAWRAWFFSRLAAIAGGPRERILGIFDVLDEWFSREDYFGCALMNAIVESRGGDSAIRQVVLTHKAEVMVQLRALTTAAHLDDAGRFAEELDLLMDGAIVKSMVRKSPRAAGEAKRITSVLLDS